MARSATWWLLAGAVSAGLVGVVLKATDVWGPGGPAGSAEPKDEAREGVLARSRTPRAADVARAGPTPSAPSSAALAPAGNDDDEIAPPARDVVGSTPRRNAVPDGRVEGEGPHGRRPHRTARNRARSGRPADGGSFHAGAVAGEDAPLATGSGRTAAHAGAPVAAGPPANSAEQATPDVARRSSDVSFTSGDERQYTTDTPVEITDTPNLAGPAGTLSFWLQPTWQDGNQDDASLLELGDGRLRIVKNVDFLRFEWTDDAGATGGIGAPIAEWKPGEWHAVTTTWNGTSFALYIDGRLVSEKDDAGHVGLPPDATLVIGSNFPENRPVAPGVIGKVDVRRRPLTPGEVANQFAAVTGSGRR